jgi:type II secretory pathway component GspD/PulD (secretin)
MKIKLLTIISALLFFTNASLAQERQPPLTAESVITASPNGSDKISLDIKGMDIVDVLKMLATRSGMNIVVGKNVTGKVTLFLKNVDVRDVFEIILLANDLAYEEKVDIINVMTQRDYELLYGERFQDKKQAKVIQLRYARAADLSKALNQIKSSIGKIVVDEGSNTLVLIDAPYKIIDMESFIRAADLPIKTKVFELKYGQADKLQAKLQEVATKNVGAVRVDERTNKIAVTDYPAKLDEIEKLIFAFDEKTPQVLIDAQIIEVRPSDKFEMGVDWDYWIKKYFRVSAALPMVTTGLSVGTANIAPSEPGQYKAVIDILRTIGDVKILSSPRIMVLNNQESRILVGTKDAYITSTVSQSGQSAVTAQSVNFVDTGIKLYVTPTINRAGFVTMKIRPEISSAKRTAIKAEDKVTEIPIVSTSEAETTVMVKDGITIIIGGLKKDEKTKTVTKIPILGDIPLLGMLFRNTSDETNRTELVILLTPHIMSGETPYTDFGEIKPTKGAVASMFKGEIITEKINYPEPGQAGKKERIFSYSEPQDTVPDYYAIISKKINEVAKINSPVGKKGKVDIRFIVSSQGYLVEEPQVISATDNFLIPFSIKAVKDAAPFPYFPRDLRKATQTFRISLFYE